MSCNIFNDYAFNLISSVNKDYYTEKVYLR